MANIDIYKKKQVNLLYPNKKNNPLNIFGNLLFNSKKMFIGLLTSGLIVAHVAQATMPADGQKIYILGVEKNEYLAADDGYLQSLHRGPEPFRFIYKGGDKFSLQSLTEGKYVSKNGYWVTMANNANSATSFTWIDRPNNQFNILRDQSGIDVHSNNSRILAHAGTNSMLLAWSDVSEYTENWRVIPEDPQFPTTDRIFAFCSVTDEQYNLPEDPANEDCTAAFQAALNAADADGGGTVFVPKGHYRIDGRLKIASNVTLRGRWRSLTASQPAAGTILKIYSGHGVDGEAYQAPIQMAANSGIMDLTFWHPNQDAANIVPYPPVLHASGTVENITFINAYQGIKMPTSSMCFINNIQGTVFKLGFFADWSKAVSRFDNIDFGPEFWEWAQLGETPLDPAYKAYMLANGTGIDIRDMDQFFMNNCKVRGMKLGLLFANSEKNELKGPSGGFLSGFDIRDCVTGFRRQSGWARIDNCYFHGTDKGAVGMGNFSSCTVKGGNAAVKNGGGLSALNTTFDGPIDLGDGRVKVINCDFEHSGNDILLGSSVDSVTIVGCTGADGLDIVDNSSGSIPKFIESERDENYLPVPPLPAMDLTTPRKPYSSAIYNIEQYGAVANDGLDDTEAFSNAVAAANSNEGGIVFIPNGIFEVSGSHTLVPGVEVRGVSGSVSSGGSAQPCSLLSISGGEGDPDGPAFLNLSTDCGVRGLNFHYSEQRASMLLPETIIHYPYTIRATGDNTYVVDINMSNPYRGIHFYQADNHLLDRSKLGNLNNSVLVEECNNGRVGRFHLKPDFWRGMKLTGYPSPGPYAEHLDLYTLKNYTGIWVKNSTNQIVNSIFNHTSHQFIRIDNASTLCHMTSCEVVQKGFRFSGEQNIKVVLGGANTNAEGDLTGTRAYWADENFTGTVNIWGSYSAGTANWLYAVESGSMTAQDNNAPGWSVFSMDHIEVGAGASLGLASSNPDRIVSAILDPESTISVRDTVFTTRGFPSYLPNSLIDHPGASLVRLSVLENAISTSPSSGTIINDGLALDPANIKIVDWNTATLSFKDTQGARTTDGDYNIDVLDADFMTGQTDVDIRSFFRVDTDCTIDIYYKSTSGRKLGKTVTYTNAGKPKGKGINPQINFSVKDAQFTGENDIEIKITGDSPILLYFNIYREHVAEAPPIRPIVSFNEETSNLLLLEGYSNIHLQGLATDEDGSVSKVELYVDDKKVRSEGAAPYDWDETRDPELLALSTGAHELILRAFDDEGNTSDARTTLTIIPIHDLTQSYDRIEAEDYDIGLAGTTYSDSTAGNAFGYYRKDDVDINRCNDVDGGFHVGNVGSGEWLDYTIHVPMSGSYQIAFRYAAEGDRKCHAKIGTTNITGAVTLSDTSSLGNWNTVYAKANLPAGQQTLRVVLGIPTDVPMNLNWIKIRPTLTTGFQIWKQKHNMPDSAGTSGDRDGDGLSNEYEYLFGLNPTNATSRQALQVVQTGTKPAYRYTGRTDAAVNYSVMISTNLVDWDIEEGVVVLDTIDNGNGTSTRVIEISLDPEVYDTGFVKIVAE